MADRPILFSGPMVRALLEGRKTMTRRVIKPLSLMDGFTMYPQFLNGARIGASSDPTFYDLSEFAVDPAQVLCASGAPYCPGDRLWVRETWNVAAAYLAPARRKTAIEIMNYAATPWAVPGAWRPSIFMPRWASRLTLAVTNVRVQRLQDISVADALAEGALSYTEEDQFARVHAIPMFAAIWDGINAERGYGWEANPWVVALTFTVQRQNIDALAETA